MFKIFLKNYNFVFVNNYVLINNFFFKYLTFYFNNFFFILYKSFDLFLISYYNVLNHFFIKFIDYFKNLLIIFFNIFVNFYRHYKFVTFVGLGFKKRLNRAKNDIYLFFGHRHWIIFSLPSNFSVYFIKRKSLIMYSNNKHKLNSFMSVFKDFKKESMFKIKGLFDIRSRKRWLFMRRAKIRGLKVKLSKKQKLL